MKKIMINKKIMGGLLLTSMVLGLGSNVFADTVDTETHNRMNRRHSIQQSYRKTEEEREAMHKEMKEKVAKVFETLIQEGTITQEQADKMKDYMEMRREENKQEREKVQAMTFEERREYFANKKDKYKKKPMDSMVEEGIVTAEQAEIIRKALPKMPRKRPQGRRMKKHGNRKHINKELSSNQPNQI